MSLWQSKQHDPIFPEIELTDELIEKIRVAITEVSEATKEAMKRYTPTHSDLQKPFTI